MNRPWLDSSASLSVEPTRARYGVVGFAVVTGYVVERTGSWTGSFYVAAAVYVVGALCWLALDPVTPLEEQGGGTRA